jgi:hypothetical protein
MKRWRIIIIDTTPPRASAHDRDDAREREC